MINEKWKTCWKTYSIDYSLLNAIPKKIEQFKTNLTTDPNRTCYKYVHVLVEIMSTLTIVQKYWFIWPQATLTKLTCVFFDFVDYPDRPRNTSRIILIFCTKYIHSIWSWATCARISEVTRTAAFVLTWLVLAREWRESTLSQTLKVRASNNNLISN